MSKYTLHYFGVNGRAGVARAILSYSKANWTNALIKKEDWPKIKKSGLCEFEQVPVLEVDGKKLCESNAINLYLAEKFNLMGKDAEENYQISNLLMTLDDIGKVNKEYKFCTDDSKKADLKKKVEDCVKFFIQKFEKRYIDLGKGKYFLGERFTLADIYITAILTNCVDSLDIKEYPWKEVGPNIEQLIKRVKENELKEFFEKYYIK